MNHYNVKGIKELLSSRRKVVLVGHKSPDGDSIGSCLALYHFLKLEHDVVVVSPDDLPDFLKWMPGVSDILVYEDQKQTVTEIIKQADIVFTLDFNDLGRVGLLAPILRNYEGVFVMVDHHQNPKDYATYSYSNTSECSTAQMIYKFINAIGSEQDISYEIAVCIYVGIMTDSGSFRFKTTSAETHKIVANLLDKGVEPQTVHEHIYSNNRIEQFNLLALTLNRIRFLCQGKVAYTYLEQKDLDRYDFRKGDTESFVNQYLSLKGVKLSVFFQESKKENIIKISFRSKHDFAVNELASKHFQGGGHFNAAGGRSKLSMTNTLAYFKSIIENEYAKKI